MKKDIKLIPAKVVFAELQEKVSEIYKHKKNQLLLPLPSDLSDGKI